MTEGLQTSGAGGPGGPASRRSFSARLLGAVRYDADVFEEVEHDPGAIGQAALVVGLAGLVRGIAAGVAGEPPGILGSIVVAYLSWFVVAALLWLLGVVIDRDTSGFFELLRTIGFAAAPILLLGVGILPALWVPESLFVVAIAVHTLAAAALVVAARQALDISTLRSVVICGAVVAILTVVAAYVLHEIAVHLEGLVELALSTDVDGP